MPSKMVTTSPPGSLPGMMTLANTPATRPSTIHATNPMMTPLSTASGERQTACVAILHIHSSVGWQRAQLLHTNLRRNCSRPFIIVVDAGDHALDSGGAERPGENQFARAFGKAAALRFRSQRTQDLDVLPIEGLRPDQPADSDRHLPFHDGKEAARVALVWLRERPDELPDIILLLQDAEKGIVRRV